MFFRLRLKLLHHSPRGKTFVHHYKYLKILPTTTVATAPLLEFEDNSNVGLDEPLQQQQPTNPEDLGPPPCYSEPTQGYSLQAIARYPQHSKTACPSQSTDNCSPESGEGYAPHTAYYPPPQGQGHVQEPGPSHVSNNSTTVVVTVSMKIE